MKKVLLFILGGFVAIGANAQQNERSAVPFTSNQSQTVKAQDLNTNFVVKGRQIDFTRNNGSANKTTGPGGDRWYSHFDVVNTFLSGALASNSFVQSIWFSRDVKQRFSTGLDTINFLSVCQVIDPRTSQLFNDPGFATEIAVGPSNAYKVDSIFITGAYVRMPNKPANQVDTMIFSVVPMDNITYYLTKASYPAKVPQYTTSDTLWAQAPTNVDSVNRAAYKATNAINPGVTWKVPMTDADGDAPDQTNNTVTVRTYPFEVPNGGVNMAPGERFAITATFKPQAGSYTPWDSVTALHRFMPISAFSASGASMPYYYEQYTDRSMSGMMFSTDTGRYTPSLFIEVFNTNNFIQEFHNIGGHVVCTDCELVGINDVNASIITKASAYPNPASSEVYVPFSLNTTADVTVSLTNAVGQTVATQTFNGVNEGKATFNAYNLNSGVYFYTVEANGQTNTGRVVVAH